MKELKGQLLMVKRGNGWTLSVASLVCVVLALGCRCIPPAVTGVWEGTVEAQDGAKTVTHRVSLLLQDDKPTLSGRLLLGEKEGSLGDPWRISFGGIRGSDIFFEAEILDVQRLPSDPHLELPRLYFRGQVTGDRLLGTLQATSFMGKELLKARLEATRSMHEG